MRPDTMLKPPTIRAPLLGRTRVRLIPTRLRTRLIAIALSILTGLLLAGAVWQIKRTVDRRLAEERARLERQDLVAFEQNFYAPINSHAIDTWQNYKSTRAIARFNDSYFVATDGGLVQLCVDGDLKRHYSVIDGLPESDLVSLATFNSALFIG